MGITITLCIYKTANDVDVIWRTQIKFSFTWICGFVSHKNNKKNYKSIKFHIYFSINFEWSYLYEILCMLPPLPIFVGSNLVFNKVFMIKYLKFTWTVICMYHRKRKTYFSSEPLSKTGLGAYHDWFHLHGITRPVRSANQQLQNEKFLPTAGFEPGTFHLRSEVPKSCATRSYITW